MCYLRKTRTLFNSIFHIFYLNNQKHWGFGDISLKLRIPGQNYTAAILSHQIFVLQNKLFTLRISVGLSDTEQNKFHQKLPMVEFEPTTS